MKFWDKTVLAVLMKYDYCKIKRGISGDKVFFFDSLEKLVTRIIPFWYDDYLKNLKDLQAEVIINVKKLKPDLVFFAPYTNQFTIDTLDLIKEICPTFAWFGDDQWRFDNYSSKYAPHYTYISTTDPWSVSKYKQIGITPILTQWAARPYSDVIGPIAEGEKYEHTLSFVGGYNTYRSWFIKQIIKYGFDVECFGVGWPNGRISFEEMGNVFRKTKINLNISNSINHDIRFIRASLKNLGKYLSTQKNSEQMKARNFEIPLSGGFELTNYVVGLERYFRIGDEVAVYGTIEECIKQIIYYLENDDERRKIAERGHQRTKSEHTIYKRLEDILEAIWG